MNPGYEEPQSHGTAEVSVGNLQFGTRAIRGYYVKVYVACVLIGIVSLLVYLKAPALQPASFSPFIGGLNELTISKTSTSHSGLPLESSNLPVSNRRTKKALNKEGKKEIFFESFLPTALVALKEVRHERLFLLEMLENIGGDEGDIVVSPSGRHNFSQDDWDRLQALSQKYRTTSLRKLIKRVNVVPPSLMLAQAALESSWGRSRFAKEGNNYFGIWTWGTQGLVPLEREEGKTHMVAAYPTTLDSARAYLLTLNRVWAYSDLRDIRQKTMDPVLLAEGLLPYSQRGTAYIQEVKELIFVNRLQRFD